MIEPYLPTDKVIHSSNGRFVIKESDDGYELWQDNPRIWLITCSNINDFREDIGKVYKIS